MKLRFARALLSVAVLAAVPTAAMAVITPTPQPPRVNPMAGPQKQVQDAQTALNTARKGVLVIRKHVEASFEAKPEFKAAKEAVDKSKADYEAETRRVTAALEKSPEYVALVAKRDKAQKLIDQSHQPLVTGSNGEDPVKITDEDINNAVKDHQDAVLAMKAMEKQNQETDPKFATLQQKRNEAQAAWDALQTQVDEALKSDPGYPPAQQAVDSAEQQLKQAKDQLAQASLAQRAAEEAAAKARASQPKSGGGPGKY